MSPLHCDINWEVFYIDNSYERALHSDAMKLFKICIHQMRISTSKIRRIRMRMRMLLDKGLFITRNATHWFIN